MEIFSITHQYSDSESIQFNQNIHMTEFDQKKTRLLIKIYEKIKAKGKGKDHLFKIYLNDDEDPCLHKIQQFILKFPYQKNLKFEDLISSKMYKFHFNLQTPEKNHEICIFASTESEINTDMSEEQIEKSYYKSLVQSNQNDGVLTKSEALIRDFVLHQHDDFHLFEQKKQLTKQLIDARTAGGAKDFMKNSYKYSNQDKMSKRQRTWLIGQGIQLYDKIYDFKDPGNRLLKNDWSMGPFYSLDQNFDSHVKKF